MTRPRWRSVGCEGASRRFADSLRRRSRSFSSRRRARRLILSSAGASPRPLRPPAVPTSAREGAGAAKPASLLLLGRRLGGLVAVGLRRAGQLVEVGALLRELRLDHVGGLRDLGVVLGLRVRRRASARPPWRRAAPAPASRPFAALASSPSPGRAPLSGSPCAACGGRTSDSTCAARCDRACSAATCWSGSSAACSPRKRASLRFERLHGPLAADAFLLEFERAVLRSGRTPPSEKRPRPPLVARDARWGEG